MHDIGLVSVCGLKGRVQGGKIQRAARRGLQEVTGRESTGAPSSFGGSRGWRKGEEEGGRDRFPLVILSGGLQRVRTRIRACKGTWSRGRLSCTALQGAATRTARE